MSTSVTLKLVSRPGQVNREHFFDYCRTHILLLGVNSDIMISNEDMILALAGQFKQLSHEPEKFKHRTAYNISFIL